MSNTIEPKLQIRLKIDVQLQSSNQIATDAIEFEKLACKFKSGTIFGYKTYKPAPNSNEDCIEDSGMHGWCYSEESKYWKYCNFHAYILDHWCEFPDLFEEVES